MPLTFQVPILSTDPAEVDTTPMVSMFFRGASPLELPHWLARGGPTPRAARQAHSLTLVRGVRRLKAGILPALEHEPHRSQPVSSRHPKRLARIDTSGTAAGSRPLRKHSVLTTGARGDHESPHEVGIHGLRHDPSGVSNTLEEHARPFGWGTTGIYHDTRNRYVAAMGWNAEIGKPLTLAFCKRDSGRRGRD